MYCEKCGAQYQNGACPNGCGTSGAAKPKKPVYKKWWFWVIVVIAGLMVIGSTGDDEEPVANNNTDSTSSVTDTVQTTTAAVDNDYHVGDIIDANGLKITYVSAEKWEGYSQYSAPDEGYMYIRLFVSAENTANTDRYFSSFDFDCYADGVKADSCYFGDGNLSGASVSSGRKLEGYIYFTVPADAQQIEVEYETNFWTDKKAILKVELN